MHYFYATLHLHRKKRPVHYSELLFSCFVKTARVILVRNDSETTVAGFRVNYYIHISFSSWRMPRENETLGKVRKRWWCKLSLASLVHLSPWWQGSNYGMWMLCSVACACLEILKKLVESQKSGDYPRGKREQSRWKNWLEVIFYDQQEACQL